MCIYVHVCVYIHTSVITHTQNVGITIAGRVIWQCQVKLKLCIPYAPGNFPLKVEILANVLQEVIF